MISHRNVIANVTQASTYDDKFRKDCAKDAGIPLFRDVVIGLLPFSHIYALVLICHTSTWRGDQVIVLPKFEQKSFFESIQHYGITALYLVSKPQAATQSRSCT
jgi:acyl-CoA synthetase (AMP-forming)/AMP-acid ligase II